MNRLRRLKGVFGLALIWSFAWVPLGLGVTLFDSLVRNRHLTFGQIVGMLPALALFGAFAGFVFGVVFAVFERKRTFGELTLARTMIWGAIGAGLMPFVEMLTRWSSASTGPGLLTTLELAVPGAVCAIATLAIARRAPTEIRPAVEPAELAEAQGGGLSEALLLTRRDRASL